MVFNTTEARALIGRLRGMDSVRSIFGANGHGFELGERLDERELVRWEGAHGAELPDEYRRYLLELGNGGAGPYYGIFPLGMWDGAGRELELVDGALGELRAPFPHASAWNLPAERFEQPEFGSDDEEDAWNVALDTEYFDPALVTGAIWISHHGCALRTILIVTGSERGAVWADRRADYSGVAPHVDSDGRHLSFGDWYMSWLETCVRETAESALRH